MNCWIVRLGQEKPRKLANRHIDTLLIFMLDVLSWAKCCLWHSAVCT